MEPDLQPQPQAGNTRSLIEEVIPVFLSWKREFFMNLDNPRHAVKAYPQLLDSLYILLDLSKADNPDTLGELREAQETLKKLYSLEEVEDATITQLEQLCDWAVTEPLSPYMTTRHPTLDL